MTMVYICGTVGFILGFIFGQMLLLFLLRDVSKEDMLNDKYIHLKYGLLNWIVAALASYGAVLLYQRYDF